MMNYTEKKTVTYIFIVCVHLVHAGFVFVQLTSHDVLWFSDCKTQGSPSLSMCALICEKSPSCLNFAYNKTDNLCKYSCRIFWSRIATDEGLIYYERKSKNLALFKPASSSSVWDNNSYQYPALALDGVLSSRTWAEECFCSSIEVSPWMQVDLQTINDIDYLKIYNRWDELGDRFHDVKIKIDDEYGKCDDYFGPAADSQVVFVLCQHATRGRYVNVSIDGSLGEDNVLTISELEIRQFN